MENEALKIVQPIQGEPIQQLSVFDQSTKRYSYFTHGQFQTYVSSWKGLKK